MVKPVYCMAGAGPGTRSKSVRWHKDAVAASGKKKPRIAYVGAASGDSKAFEMMIGGLVFGLGADVTSIKLAKKSAKTSTAREQLAEADIIFITGGDVDAGMRILHDRDMASYLRELHTQGKIFEAVSAGSIMLGTNWVRFPDENDDSTAEPFDCIGIVPHAFDAHSEEDEWSELRVLARLLARKPRPPEHVFGLVSGTCGMWDGERLHALGGNLHRFNVAIEPHRAPDLEAEDSESAARASNKK